MRSIAIPLAMLGLLIVANTAWAQRGFAVAINTDAHTCSVNDVRLGTVLTFSGDDIDEFGFDIADRFVDAACIIRGKYYPIGGGVCIVTREGRQHTVRGVTWRPPFSNRTIIYCVGVD